MQGIPEKYHDLLSDETKAFAVISTIMPDGSPQATVVWFNTDREHILVNSVKGRVKDRNMRARPQVALTIFDPENMYDYLQVRGLVIEITEEGGRDHIDTLAGKYMGQEKFEGPQEDVRVIYKIQPR